MIKYLITYKTMLLKPSQSLHQNVLFIHMASTANMQGHIKMTNAIHG